MRLAPEALKHSLIARDSFRQKLEGDEAAKLRILGPEHDAHPAATQFFQNAIVGDRAADWKLVFCHVLGILVPLRTRVNRGAPSLRAVVFPLRIAGMAAPCRALHRHRHVKKCAHVGNGPVQFLEVHIQRLALGAARLLVQPDALHVKTFENRLVEQLLRVLRVAELSH